MTKKPQNVISFLPGDRYLKLAIIEKAGAAVKADKTTQVKAAEGVIENGRIKEISRAKELITELFDQAGIKELNGLQIVFVVPEELSFLHTFIITEKKIDRKQKIKEELSATLPLSISDISFFYQAFPVTPSAAGDKERIITYALNRKALDEWQGLFHRLGISIIDYELEVTASYQGLFASLPELGRCLVDIKEEKTVVSIFTEQGLSFSYIYFFGLESIDRLLGTKREDTEKLIRQHNLMDEGADALAPVCEPWQDFINDLKQNIEYFEREQNKKVGEVILIGHSHKFNGLEKLSGRILNKRVVLGSGVVRNLDLGYLSAVGAGYEHIMSKRLFPRPALDMPAVRGRLKLERFKGPDPGTIIKSLKNNKTIWIISAFIAVFILIVAAKPMYNRNRDVLETAFKYHLEHQISWPLDLDKNDIAARVFEVEVAEPRETGEAVKIARNEAINSLEPKMSLAAEPVNPPNPEKGVIYPYTFKFIGYNRNLAHNKCITELDLALKGAEFRLDEIDFNINKGTGQDYTLDCLLRFYTSQEIDPLPVKETTPEIKRLSRVREGIAGNVNLRSGPGVDHEVVGQVRAGDELDLIDVDGGWTRIIRDGQTAWIISSVLETSE
jgi:Tfp pilus assembly PilM family ATPase